VTRLCDLRLSRAGRSRAGSRYITHGKDSLNTHPQQAKCRYRQKTDVSTLTYSYNFSPTSDDYSTTFHFPPLHTKGSLHYCRVACSDKTHLLSSDKTARSGYCSWRLRESATGPIGRDPLSKRSGPQLNIVQWGVHGWFSHMGSRTPVGSSLVGTCRCLKSTLGTARVVVSFVAN
jgi:hypothetical protein